MNVAAVSVGLFNNVVKQPTKATTVEGGAGGVEGRVVAQGDPMRGTIEEQEVFDSTNNLLKVDPAPENTKKGGIKDITTITIPGGTVTNKNGIVPDGKTKEQAIFEKAMAVAKDGMSGRGLPSDKTSKYSVLIDKCFGTGGKGMNRAQLAELIGVKEDDISDEFWNAITKGKGTIGSTDALDQALWDMQVTLQAGGGTLRELISSDKIIVIDARKGGETIWGRIGPSDLINNPFLKQMNARARRLAGLGEAGKVNDKKSEEARKYWEYMAVLMVMHNNAQLKDNQGSGMSKLNLSDPLVLGMYYEMHLEKMKGNGKMEDGDINKLLKKQDKIKDFRAWAKGQEINEQDINGFTTDEKKMGELLDNYKKWGKNEVNKYLLENMATGTVPVSLEDLLKEQSSNFSVAINV